MGLEFIRAGIFNGRIKKISSSLLWQISSTMVGTKGKMYTEIKVKERRFLEFRNKRKERQKQPKSSIKLQADLAIALTLGLNENNSLVLLERK